MKRSIDQGNGGRWRAKYGRPDGSTWFMSPARGFSTQALASKSRDDFEDALIKPHVKWAVEEERKKAMDTMGRSQALAVRRAISNGWWRAFCGLMLGVSIGVILARFLL